MKINIIGEPRSIGMPAHLAELLWRYGHQAYLNSLNYDYFDVNMVLGLWYLRPEILHHNNLIYGCGSDVWANPRLASLLPYLEQADLMLYGHPDMPTKTGVPGTYWQLPADTQKFRKSKPNEIPPKITRDTLIYMPNPVTYNISKVLQYIVEHPQEKITLIGAGFQDIWMADLPPNLLTIRWMPYNLMRNLYLQHHTLRKWLTHKATPTGKMEIEALLCGLKAYLNDKQITEPPKQMLDYNAIPKLLEMIQDVVDDRS